MDHDMEDTLRTALEDLAEKIEGLYHRASREFELPHGDATYAANQPEGQRWSCAYRPTEVAEFVRQQIDSIVISTAPTISESAVIIVAGKLRALNMLRDDYGELQNNAVRKALEAAYDVNKQEKE